MKRLLVTGGAGFIGSNFIRYMLNQYPEYEIINLDALTYAGNLQNLTDVQSNAKYCFIKGDIADGSAVRHAIANGIDAIVNFAAETHVDRSIENPQLFIRTNVLGTQVLLDAAIKYNIKKYVQISTDEVYGTLSEGGHFTEDTPLTPNSPYSASKAGADLLVRAYHETYGLDVNITRCSNNYGPFQFPEKLIPLVITKAFSDQEIPVYGDGLQIRDWLQVEDHCRAIDLVLHKGENGEVYNIGGNNEFTNLEIVKTILDQMGKSISLIKHIQDRPGHDRRYAINAEKIKTQLKWSPYYEFANGIKETVRWYLEHAAWWQNVKQGSYHTG